MAAAGGLITGVMGLAQGMYQSQVAENNAKIARINARNTLMKGQMDVLDRSRQNRGMMGELVAQQGASGIALTSPSSGRVRSSAARIAREETNRIMYNAELSAWGSYAQASQFEAQAQADKIGGVASMIGGVVNAGSSLVGGSSSVSDKWDWMLYS